MAQIAGFSPRCGMAQAAMRRTGLAVEPANPENISERVVARRFRRQARLVPGNQGDQGSWQNPAKPSGVHAASTKFTAPFSRSPTPQQPDSRVARPFYPLYSAAKVINTFAERRRSSPLCAGDRIRNRRRSSKSTANNSRATRAGEPYSRCGAAPPAAPSKWISIRTSLRRNK